MGRLEGSVAEARRALELDPLDVLLNIHLGWAYLHARRYDDAIAQSLKAIAMDPNIEAAHTGLGRAYLGNKMYGEALAEFEKTVTLSGGTATGPDTYHRIHVCGAIIYTGLGEKDQAFEWLQKAIVERSGGLLQLKADLMFDPIRSDPRFTDLIGRPGPPQ